MDKTKRYEFGNVVVNIHGQPNQEKLKKACVRFFEQIERSKKEESCNLKGLKTC